MTCLKCKKEVAKLTYCGDGFACKDCLYVSRDNTVPHFIETVNFKNYFKNGGNVSKARIDMVRSRKMAPDGNGEVVLKNSFGKITDKRSVNY